MSFVFVMTWWYIEATIAADRCLLCLRGGMFYCYSLWRWWSSSQLALWKDLLPYWGECKIIFMFSKNDSTLPWHHEEHIPIVCFRAFVKETPENYLWWQPVQGGIQTWCNITSGFYQIINETTDHNLSLSRNKLTWQTRCLGQGHARPHQPVPVQALPAPHRQVPRR